jgi:hypothetical protein
MRYQLKFIGVIIINAPYLSGCFMFFGTSAFKLVGLFYRRFLCILWVLVFDYEIKMVNVNVLKTLK